MLVERTGELERWRALFGDERLDYERRSSATTSRGRRRLARALRQRLRDDAPVGGLGRDFAHYLHIRDTLQTAAAFGLVVAGPASAPGRSVALSAPVPDAAERPFDAIIADWLPLTYALNAVNRSMGHEDLYPFTLAPTGDREARVRPRPRRFCAAATGFARAAS
jgi:hypothetical protein